MTVLPQRQRKPQGLSVIRGRKRFSRLIIFPWIVYLALIGAAFIGLAYSQTSMNEGAVTLEDLRQDIAVEQARTAQLRLEIARLRSPDRIIQEAEALGMQTPSVPLQTVVAVGVRQPEVAPYASTINETGSGAGAQDGAGTAQPSSPPGPSDG